MTNAFLPRAVPGKYMYTNIVIFRIWISVRKYVQVVSNIIIL